MRPAFVLLCCLLLSGFMVTAGPNTFVLKNAAVVSDTIVKMKDIAHMDKVDKQTRDKVGELVVAVSPEMGRQGSIRKQEVYEKLIGNGVTSPQLRGAAVVKIERKGSFISPAFFKEQIHNYIINNSKWNDGVEVQIVSKKRIVVPSSGIKWKLEPANGQDFFGNVLFKITALRAATNEEVYSNWVVAKLKITKKVAVSNRTIQRNESISPDSIRWETRQITVFTKDALFDAGSVVGKRTGRVVRPNTVITTNLLAKRYLVKRGSMATLIAKLPSIKAPSSVKVLSDGGAGDIVRVMNTSSRKILYATVTGENKLEVSVQ